MSPDIHISYRHLDPSPALTARIEAEIEHLLQHWPALQSCRVVVETLHRHHRQGHHYQLHLELRMPGAEVAVTHDPGARPLPGEAGLAGNAKRMEIDPAHRDPYVVVRDAFHVAHRRLESKSGRERSRRRQPDLAAGEPVR